MYSFKLPASPPRKPSDLVLKGSTEVNGAIQELFQHGTPFTGEGLRGGRRHNVYKRISLLKSDAGPCDGLGGCSPCLPQSHLTESQMADFLDKPGRNPPQTTHLFIFRAWPCWPFTTFYMLGWSLGPSAGRFGFFVLEIVFCVE